MTFALRRCPLPFVISCLVALPAAAVGVALPWLTSTAIAQVQSQGTVDTQTLLQLGTVFLIWSLTDPLVDLTSKWLVMAFDARVALESTEEWLGRPTVDHYEDGVLAELADRAQGSPTYGVWRGLMALPGLLASRVSLSALAVVVGLRYSWLSAALVAASVLLVEWTDARGVRHELRVREGETDGQRRAGYLYELATGAAVEETRLYDNAAWFQSRFDREWTSAMKPVWAERWRGMPMKLGPAVLMVTAVAVSIAVTSAWGLGEGTLATAIPLLLALVTSANGVAAANVAIGASAAQALVTFKKEAVRRFGPLVVGAFEDPPREHGKARSPEIRFEDVWYRYPDSGVDVLKGLTFTVPAGQSAGLVGVNGAGKTTLTKLIAGAVLPTAGRVLIDGRDTTAMSATETAALQRQQAVLGQSFARYPLSLRANVLLDSDHPGGGSEWRPEDDDLGPFTSFTSFTSDFEDGLETVVGDGTSVQLSGGQWQRIGLARASHSLRSGCSLLILDEPTSSLDPEAELHLVRQYSAFTAGVTSLVVSHRFSVVKECDQILVLRDGVIDQAGTHQQLMAVGGYYARAFEAQVGRVDGRRT